MISIETIQRVVAEHYGITVEKMIRKGRPSGIVWPRQVAMYLARKLTSESLHTIGARFRHNYKTVHYAFTAVQERMEVDAKERALVEQLEAKILNTR